MKYLEALQETRRLIANPANWGQGRTATHKLTGEHVFVNDVRALPEGSCYLCIWGAFCVAAPDLALQERFLESLRADYDHPAQLNDHHTHAEVLAWLDAQLDAQLILNF